jgi:hypothetical protein
LFRDAVEGGLLKQNPFEHLPSATLEHAVENQVEDAIAELRGTAKEQEGEWCSVAWIQEVTANGLTSEQLRKARQRGTIEARQVGGRWKYELKSLSCAWPEYQPSLETGQNRTEPDDLENGPSQHAEA